MRIILLPCLLRVPVEDNEILHWAKIEGEGHIQWVKMELELPDGTLLPLDEDEVRERLWVTRMHLLHEQHPELGIEFFREHWLETLWRG